eukprot:2530584-Amphidinium_carterae.1
MAPFAVCFVHSLLMPLCKCAGVSFEDCGVGYRRFLDGDLSQFVGKGAARPCCVQGRASR